MLWEVEFHGCRIRFRGSPAIYEALRHRFRFTTGQVRKQADLFVEFRIANSAGDHFVEKPGAKGRQFYEPVSGVALYFPETDRLYLDASDLVRVLCQPSDGTCQISVIGQDSATLRLATHQLFTIPFLEMLKRRSRYSLHAAALGWQQRSLLFPGTSGAGKSTLTLALLRKGFDLIADDMVFIEGGEELTVLAFPEDISATETTLEMFAELRRFHGESGSAAGTKYEISSSSVYCCQIAWRSEPAALLFPEIHQQQNSELVQIGPDEAFLLLSSNVFLTESISTQEHLKVLAKLAQRVPCYRLHTGWDLDGLPALCKGLLH